MYLHKVYRDTHHLTGHSLHIWRSCRKYKDVLLRWWTFHSYNCY